MFENPFLHVIERSHTNQLTAQVVDMILSDTIRRALF